MFVNKYQINLNSISSASTATTINIPLNMDFQLVDQCELIDRVFVQTEIEKSINPIFDYEKVRFIPVLTTGNTTQHVDILEYNVTFLAGSPAAMTGTTYADIGFTNDDIKFQKNSFKESFLTLLFYDSDNALEQRLISFITLHPKLSTIDLEPLNSINGIPGQPKPANQISVRFTLANPITQPMSFSEGYHLYDYKDTVDVNSYKSLYMRAVFNNAKTGKSFNMMVEGVPYTIDQLVNKLYTRYILVRDKTGFYYQIDPVYSNNVIYTSDDVTVNLFQIQAL